MSSATAAMLLLVVAAHAAPGPAAAAASSANATAAPTSAATPAPLASGDAQRLYAKAKEQLLQIRVLTSAGRSQASVGSGFVVGEEGLTITNYHVISKLALEPERYVAEAVDTSGQKAELRILAIDVLDDLAVLRIKRPAAAHGSLSISNAALEQGQRLYSLGNPLDLGFAISEGRFNGLLARPYYEQILFSGAINPGMSGGPTLDEDGKVVGVNVAKRLDGELISFLVPARFIAPLITRALAAEAHAPSTSADFHKDISGQLLAHQSMMADRLLATPFATRPLGPYLAPVHEAPGVRCWGNSPNLPEKPYRVDRLSCRMESSLFIDEGLNLGYINIRHERISSDSLGALRFSRLYSGAFRNEFFGSHLDKRMTGPHCTEAFVQAQASTPPLRAVLCVRALRKFDELYEFNLLTATLDHGSDGLQSRIDVAGVSYENGLRITQTFLAAIGKAAP